MSPHDAPGDMGHAATVWVFERVKSRFPPGMTDPKSEVECKRRSFDFASLRMTSRYRMTDQEDRGKALTDPDAWAG